MTHKRSLARRGAAAGWIVLILILAVLAGVVAVKMVCSRKTLDTTTTAPDRP